MIVKVQLSLRTTAPVRQALIYNEKHSVFWQGDATEEIVEAMDGDARAFFHAHRKGKLIVLDRRAPEQGW